MPMESINLSELRDQLQRERQKLLKTSEGNEEALQSITATSRRELEEDAQRERDADALEGISQTVRTRIRDIDTALARMDAGAYATCQNCGREISAARLRAKPTTALCTQCAEQSAAEADAPMSEEETTHVPKTGGLPPDLEILDDQERTGYLEELIREDGRIDMQELHVSTQSGVVYLEGALPSEPERQILLNLITDVAGVQDIVDHLEIQRLGWERSDRSKPQDAEDAPAGNLHRQEPYGGTEDVTLTEEEGVTYEPPENPPPPPHRKD